MTDTMTLDPTTTALVVIDLQRGILGRETSPHATADVVARAAQLAAQCRKVGATVVLVNVSFSGDEKHRLAQPVDSPNPPGRMAEGFDVLDPALGAVPSDIRITKRQWGAFYGTALDLELRRRGVKTIILCGIATNVGVESTARDAWERNYNLVFAEDAMASATPGGHEFTIKTTFPRIGRVRRTSDILAMLPA
jgi:nicotinamidase-related amidase